METTLFEPAKLPESPVPAMAVPRADKIELSLDKIGELLFFAGILGLGIGLLIFACNAINGGLNVLAFSGLAFAISSIVEGWVLRVLFRGIAEIVRLLRRIADKP
jgi:hypothetical protein